MHGPMKGGPDERFDINEVAEHGLSERGDSIKTRNGHVAAISSFSQRLGAAEARCSVEGDAWK